MNRFLTILLTCCLMPSVSLVAQDTIKSGIASLELVDDVEVASLEPGVVQRVEVEIGQQVKQGAVLMRLDEDRYQAEAIASDLALKIAEVEASNDVNLRFSQKSADVNQKRLEKSRNANRQYAGSITETEIDRLRLELEQSELSIEQSALQQETNELTVELRQREQEIASIALRRRKLVAPLDGMVIRLSVQAGEAVTAGQTAVRIINLNRLRAKSVLPASDFNRITLQSKAWFIRQQDDGSEKRYAAEVKFLDPEVDSVEQVFNIWVDIDNTKRELLPGLRGYLEIQP